MGKFLFSLPNWSLKKLGITSNKCLVQFCSLKVFFRIAVTFLFSQECLVPVTPETRALFIIHLVRHQNVRRILCFTNARITAVRLAILLKHIRGVQASQLSAQMPPDKRQRILNAFSRGGLNVSFFYRASLTFLDDWPVSMYYFTILNSWFLSYMFHLGSSVCFVYG